MPRGQKPKHEKQKRYCSKFNEDFRSGPCRKKKKHKSPEGSGSWEGRMVGLWTGDAKNSQAFEEP